MVSSTATVALWTILSSRAATASRRCRPSAFGMYRRRDGSARYAPRWTRACRSTSLSSRSAWPAAFVTTREITPQLLGPLGCPIDEGVDRLATHGPQTTFVSSLQPAGNLLRGPPLREAVDNEGS